MRYSKVQQARIRSELKAHHIADGIDMCHYHTYIKEALKIDTDDKCLSEHDVRNFVNKKSGTSQEKVALYVAYLKIVRPDFVIDPIPALLKNARVPLKYRSNLPIVWPSLDPSILEGFRPRPDWGRITEEKFLRAAKLMGIDMSQYD